MSIVTLNHIVKYYGTEDCRQQVLDDISLTVEEGELISIMGPSGSGKSTLLNIIGLLDKQSSGDYFLCGEDISVLNEKNKAMLRNQRLGVIFQSFNLIKELSAMDNVQLALQFSNIYKQRKDRMTKKEISLQSGKLLEMVGLKSHRDKKPSQLSGGQQQRVAIARALANQPQLILADEPTGALDQKNGHDIIKILSELNDMGKTIIIITHDENVMSSCKRHLVINDGKLSG